MTELGKVLKEARESKGITLDDLQQLTKIQKRYLIGIEEGNYEMMPGKFYVRAFIKQYAEAVGLDADQLFEEHQTDIPAPAVQQEEAPQNLSRVQSKKSIPVNNSKWVEIMPKVLVAVFIIAVIAIIYYFVAKAVSNQNDAGPANDTTDQIKVEQNESENTNQKEENQGTESKKDENATNDSEDDQSEKEKESNAELAVKSTSGNRTTYELKNADEFKITLKSTGETWLKLSNGEGKSYYQGLLTDGKSEEADLTEEDSAQISIGNSTDTEVYVNGQKLEYESEAIVQNITIEFTKQ